MRPGEEQLTLATRANLATFVHNDLLSCELLASRLANIADLLASGLTNIETLSHLSVDTFSNRPGMAKGAGIAIVPMTLESTEEVLHPPPFAF